MVGEDFQWVHLSGSSELEYARTSAQLFANGYVEALSAEPNQSPWLSETLNLDFEITVDMIYRGSGPPVYSGGPLYYYAKIKLRLPHPIHENFQSRSSNIAPTVPEIDL